MARSKSLKETFAANKNDEEKLRKLFESTDAGQIAEVINETAGESLGYTLWSKLIAFLKDEDKLFDVVKEVRSLNNCKHRFFNFYIFLGPSKTKSR